VPKQRKIDPSERLLYSPAEAAVVLDLSRATLYRMIAAGQLTTIHAGITGKSLRITRASIDRWLADRLAEAGHVQ
jgi:excisionase family DNA binding protein